jgi:uncharacterized protein
MKGFAMITGASSGLGAYFAQQLAARGYDLVLVARRLDRLEALAAQFRGSGRQVEIVGTDLAEGSVDGLMSSIRAKGITVELLINNAGFGLRGEFASMPEQAILGMIDVNVRAVSQLARAVLPEMIARRSGGVLNIASTAAFQPGPKMAVYYATKAYVLSLSQALHEEVKPYGVHVTCLCPGPTATEFADRADMRGTVLFRVLRGRPAPVIEAGLSGLAANRAVVVPGPANKLFAAAARVSPGALTLRIAHSLQR